MAVLSKPACLALLASLCMASATTLASDTSATQGDVVLFPGDLFAPMSTDNPVPAVASGRIGINMPGHDYRAGNGWWALSCAKQGCALSSTALSIVPMTHPQYDGDPLPSQGLFWSPFVWQDSTQRRANDPRLLLMFKPLRALAVLPLQAGPVTTWLHAGQQPYPRPATPGTLEVSIPLPDGSQALLVPRWIRPNPDNAAQSERYGGEIVYELRSQGKRQRLFRTELGDGTLGNSPSGVALQWAGDLDGDGRLDLLLVFADSGWNVRLYLSSLAKADELVGEAGSFDYFPPDQSGC